MNSCVDCSTQEDDETTEKRSRRFRRARYFFQDLPGRSMTGTAAPTSDRTREHCDRIFKTVCDQPLSRAKLQFIHTLINRSPKGDNLLEPLDEKGWNILQRSVICNQIQVVSMLIGKGVDINGGMCTLPLHLACKLGHAHIVEMLLDNGGKADLSRGVCYPVSHCPKTTAPPTPSASATRAAKARCFQGRLPAQPLAYAIPNDRYQVVRVLLTHKTSRDIVKRDYLLHEACNCRAKRSLKLLVEMMPEQVNLRDKKGLTPLQHTLMGLKNRECAVILLESSAQFSPDIFETQYGTTFLHQLYTSDDTSFLFRLTELMLKKGPSDLATRTTKGDGDTLLNRLLKNFGSPKPRDRELYVSEVKACINLLIAHGCDPNYANKKGETALHSLMAHSEQRPLFYIRDRFGVSPQYLSIQLKNTCSLMEVLFLRGAQPNTMEEINGVSPLYYLMRIICAMSINHLSITLEQVKCCIRILCDNGADPNEISAVGDNTMTLLFGSLSRWLYNASDDPSNMEKLLAFTEDTLNMFLKHGLEPQTFLRKNLKQFMIIFNSTNLDETFIRHLNELLKAVISSGGNPNMIKLTDLHGGMSTSFAAKYTVGYYLARGLYIHARYRNQATFEILEIFKNTLSQDILAKLVGGICDSLETVFEHGAHNLNLQRRIRSINQPRSLKQLCRIGIYNALQWKLDTGCDLLPLPLTLKLYLKNI